MTPARAAAAGVSIILATNAIAIGGALYNRGGAPDSQLTLSERELTAPYSWGWREENSGLSLNLSWRVAVRTGDEDSDAYEYGYGVDVDWFDATKLAALGFDTSLPPDDAKAQRHYHRQLAHDALLVVELNGPAYAKVLQSAQKHAARAEAHAAAAAPDDKEAHSQLEVARSRLSREQNDTTRLFVVDAGSDLPTLRKSYPDTSRYAIVRGHVGIAVCIGKKGTYLCGRIEGLEASTVNVPLDLRPAFEGAEQTYAPAPNRVRYSAVVAFGRRLEPWLVSAERQK